MGNEYYRAHRHGSHDKLRKSQNKTNQLFDLLTAHKHAQNQYTRYYHARLTKHGERMSKWGANEHPLKSSPLSARHQVVAWNNATQSYNGYLTRVQDDVRAKIGSLDRTKYDTITMYRLNAQENWYPTEYPTLDWLLDNITGKLSLPKYTKQGPKIPKDHSLITIPVEDETLSLYKHIVRHCFKTNKLPTKRSLSTNLNKTVAEIQLNTDAKHDRISGWLKIATLTKGKPILLPIEKNTWSDLSNLAGTVQINMDKETQEYSIGVIKKFTALPLDPNKPEKDMGNDIGLSRALIATSEGDLYGAKFLARLRELDAKLTRVINEIKEENKTRSKKLSITKDPRYKRLQKQISDYSKNEINRILNLLVSRGYNILVFEKLDFRGGGLSRRLNRLLTRIGLAQLKRKLENLVEEKKLASVDYVPSAYSSQECSECHFIHKNNRKGDTFKCLLCGFKCHADVNGARVTRGRRATLPPGLTDSSKRGNRENLRQFLEDRFTECYGVPMCEALVRGRSIIGARHKQDSSLVPPPAISNTNYHVLL